MVSVSKDERLRHGKRLTRLAALLAGAAIFGALAASTASATPWAETGDRQLRQDVELLASRHIITGPINSWPLAWSQMSVAEQVAGDAAAPAEVRAAAARIVARYTAAQTGLVEANIMGTSRSAIVRDFGSQPRAKGDFSARIVQDFGNLTVSLGAGYRVSQGDAFRNGAKYNFESSYAAWSIGNWAVYGGYVDSWWGPGEDGALMLSNNARPSLKVGVKRLLAYPIDLPVLRWLGPIRFDAFVSRLEGGRNDYQHPYTINYRVDFAPPVLPGLEIGLSRQSMLCGSGSYCTFSSVLSQVIVVGRQYNNGIAATDAADKLAGIDISYRTHFGRVAAQVYGEMQAEDAGGFLISQYGRKVGARLTAPLGDSGTTLMVGSEYTDTLANNLLGGHAYPGSFYNNNGYTDGKRNHGLASGESIDGDGNLFSIDVAVTDPKNRYYYASLRRANINQTNVAGPSDTLPVRNALSGNYVRIDIATLGVVAPTPFGDLTAEVRHSSDIPNHIGPAQPRFDVSVGWRVNFGKGGMN